MRILMLHEDPAGGWGGATHMAWRTADALAARGHEVAIAGTPPAPARPAGPATAPTRPAGPAVAPARPAGPAVAPAPARPDPARPARPATAPAHPTSPAAGPATSGPATDSAAASGGTGSWPLGPGSGIAAAAAAQLAPGMALAAAVTAPAPASAPRAGSNGTGGSAGTSGTAGRARWLGVELPGSLGEAIGRAGWVPEVVHVTDLAHPGAARCGLALADAAGAPFALTPATDPALWHDAIEGQALAGQADVVFALTPSESAGLAALGVPATRIAPLAQGPQLVGTPDPAGFRARVGAAGPLVLFLGRKLPTKGHQHLLAAAPGILARHPTATIVVAGPEPSGSPATGPGDDHPYPDRVHRLGALDEVDKHSALLAADVLVLPSVADAFPLVFVEAWTCGVPVVSGPFPGAREVVRDGVDGLVVDADPAAVGRAVGDLLADPGRRRAMGAAGRRRALTELSWDAVAADAERGYHAAARPLVATASSSET